MKQWLFALSLLIVAALGLCPATYAQDSDHNELGPYKQIGTVPIPNFTGFDISWVDSENARYYLANRGNALAKVNPSITVINTESNNFTYNTIPMPNGASGAVVAPNGVVAIHRNGGDDQSAGTLVVGGSDSTAIFFDLANPLAAPFTVSTRGTKRADELAYDPLHHIILIANDQDAPPFVTFISTEGTPQWLGQILYDGKQGRPQATNGIEQPVWDVQKKRFYISIPATATNPNGEVDEIDPVKMRITGIIPTAAHSPTCGPAGLALIPGQRLITSCGDVLDIDTGSVVTTVPGVSADEIWYNPGDERVYFGGFLSVPVVSGEPPYGVIDILPWKGFFAVPPAPSQFSHSIAADSENNRIFLPVTNVGVLVFTDEKPDNQ